MRSVIMTSFSRIVVSVLSAGFLLVGCGGKQGEEKKPEEAKDDTAEKAAPQEDLGLTPEQAAKVVARVGEREITVGDVTEQINRLSPYIRRRWAAPEKRKEFLQKLIRVELLSQEAERLGLGDDPEVQRTVKQVMIRLMVKNDLEKDVLPSTVPEEELKAEYEKDHDKYHRPAQVRASQIVVKTEEEAKKLIVEAQANSEDRKFFRDKAKKISIDEATKERGGDLGYFSKPGEGGEDEPEVAREVATAVWTLEKVGDVYGEPIKTDAGYHVVKLTNKKPEMNRSFESVKRLIENRLLRQARREGMDKFVEDLKAKAKIEIFEDNLGKLEAAVGLDEAGRHVHGGHPPQLEKPEAKEKPEDGDEGDEG